MSGRLMLRALIAGKATPQEMAELAKGLLRKKIPELELALEGKLEQHHRPVGASAATTRSGGKRPGGSRTTHPADARTLCGAAGLIGRDTRCGLDSGRGDHRRVGRGHESVRKRLAVGFLGRSVPR